MELRQLRYAMAVAEYLGFERAARALGVSQSVVSRGVSRLEDELGITLFERTPAGVRVTQTGRSFLTRAQRPFGELQDLQSYALSAGRAETGSLAVAFHPDLSSGLLRKILATHRLLRPEVVVHFYEDAPAAQLVALRERRADICVLTSADTTPGAESETFWNEGVALAVPSSHALASADQIRWDEVHDQPFIVRRHASGPVIASWLSACLGFAGRPPNIEQHDVSRSAIFGLVGCGYGLTACSASSTGVDHPGVVFIPVVGERSTVPIRLAWLAENFNPVLQSFLTHARNVVRQSGGGQAALAITGT